MVAAGFFEASYGRKGHLKAVWLRKGDGSSPVEAPARAGTRYSFLQKLDNGGRCWKLRRVDGRDEDGMPVTTRGVFLDPKHRERLYCADPFKLHRVPHVSECVDHIVPHKGDQQLFWDQSNWQALCRRCNSIKCARLEGGFGNASA